MNNLVNIAGATLGIGIALYVLAVFGMFAFQRHLLYKPEGIPAPPKANDVPEMREILFRTTDGLALAAWWSPPPSEEAATVIIFHGNSGNRAWVARKIRLYLDAGFGVMAPDYRGFGGNPGSPSEDGLRIDAVAARNYVLEEGVRENRLFYHGESLGSGVATWLATEHPPRGLILEAAFTSIPDVAQGIYPWLPARAVALDRFTSLRRIGQVRAPVLLLHGEKDETVPHTHSQELLEAHPGPKQRITFPDGEHANLYDHGAGVIAISWIHDQLYSRESGSAASGSGSLPAPEHL
ncbi:MULTISPECIES: alpha/beta hydrolase [unclassified Haematospirillum]|uniref:alpha/beta hydrolase n=1 Tax=unclassified Haematospirillum TaxID=2622088 RepID=UPI00143B80DA|nr:MULTISPECIES: alpha/beta hydrolase [unclassified Haematospirillum]NKD54782.1 alpha/beta hydrolase [Haematospirillum sp. H4890]NKD74620.1 alpha/beta hydrolase [Haematospirillum sp. H4485]NKD87494.1 alpha/beta hydrolase [Haematospirillum sp. 15-248]